MTPTPSRRRGVCALALVLLTTAGCSTGTTSSARSHGLPAPIREVLPNGMRLIIEEHRAASTVAIHLWTGPSHRDHRIVAEIALDCVTSSA
jgi:hypothetical protein